MPLYKIRRDDLENQLNKGALWAVTYGDLMSYLMIFFLVLFSFSIAQNDKTAAKKYEESISNIQKAFGGKENKDRIEKAIAIEKENIVTEKIKKSVESEALNNLIKLEENERKIKLVLSEAVLFDSGKSELKDNAKKVLEPIMKNLRSLPNQILIEGHTDNVPIKSGKYLSNMELSMARAYSVIKFLEEQGFNKNQLAGIGYGESRPIADNSTQEGRSKNRRIEISLLKTE